MPTHESTKGRFIHFHVGRHLVKRYLTGIVAVTERSNFLKPSVGSAKGAVSTN